MNDVNAEGFESFCRIIQDTLELFDDLISFENKKLDAIAANDVALLDRYMNDEQAYLLKMRGLDQKREKMQGQLGATDLTFRELTDRFSGHERETLVALYEKLSAKSLELKDSIAATKRYIDLHLNSISSLLEKLEGNAAPYGKNGEKERKAPPARFTPTKA